jgi:hypothetical protein
MMDAALKQAGSADTEVLHDRNENFIRAVRESDAAWFDRNVTSDFLNSNADGSLADRAQSHAGRQTDRCGRASGRRRSHQNFR